MLVVSPIMSATQNSGRLLNLMLAKPSIDRASELRTDPVKLDELWKSAKVLILAGDRVQSSSDALVLLDWTQVQGEGEKYFLGIVS